MHLECNLLGLKLKSPLVLASGITGTSADLMERVAKCGAGAVTSKSCSLEPRSGHPNPVAVEWDSGLINAIGLTNPGVEEEIVILKETKKRLDALGIPLFASIFASSVEEYGQVASEISEASPDLIEVNISCPNVSDEFGTPFSGSPEAAENVTKTVKSATNIPISVKLSPNVPNIAVLALAVVKAGADCITAINTMPGMIVDAYAKKPVLANRSGGISGPALKPIALKCVADIRRVVDVPIIGTGGISSGIDAAEMLMAGATLVGIGSAVWYRGIEAFNQINLELADFMKEEKYTLIDEMRGAAL